MAKFAFSLQRVLDYRRLEEGWAQDAYREAREARDLAERALQEVRERRTGLLFIVVDSIVAHIELEACHRRLDQEEETAQDTLAQRCNDEARAEEEWVLRRQAAEALQKLHDSAHEEWEREENRREQADLDEWAVLRR